MTPADTRHAPSRHSRSFHNWRSEYAEHSITRAIREGRLTPEDAALITEYIAEAKATRGICQGRANKVTFTLVQWRRFIGPFRSDTMDDLHVGIEHPEKPNIIRNH